MKKVWCFLFSSLLVMGMLSGCRNPFTYFTYENAPCQQPGTKWQSEDGTISFYVDENYHATGTMIVDGECVDIYFTNDMGFGAHIYPISVLEDEALDDNDRYEYWTCSFRSKEKFIATVKETTFFEVGQKIVFYRVAEGIKVGERQGTLLRPK